MGTGGLLAGHDVQARKPRVRSGDQTHYPERTRGDSAALATDWAVADIRLADHRIGAPLAVSEPEVQVTVVIVGDSVPGS